MNARATAASVVSMTAAFEGIPPLSSGLVFRAGISGGELENLTEVWFG